jgi:hypothetical protein
VPLYLPPAIPSTCRTCWKPHQSCKPTGEGRSRPRRISCGRLSQVCSTGSPGRKSPWRTWAALPFHLWRPDKSRRANCGEAPAEYGAFRIPEVQPLHHGFKRVRRRNDGSHPGARWAWTTCCSRWPPILGLRHGGKFLDNAAIDEGTRAKVARLNANSLLKLKF